MTEFEVGETISSWLERQIVYASQDGANVNIKGVRRLLESPEVSDIDYYSDSEISELIALLPFAPPDIFFRSKSKTGFMLAPPLRRVNFCSDCVKGDMKAVKTAVWREAWSYGWYVICEIHGTKMCSLGFNLSRSTEHRATEACRIVIDQEYQHEVTSSVWPIHAKSSVNGAALLSRLDHEVVNLALLLQQRIMLLVAWEESIAGPELAVVYDLFSLILRGHTHYVEPRPFCFQVAKKITGRNFSVERTVFRHEDDRFSAHLEIKEPYPRLLALAIISFLLGLPGAAKRWDRVRILLGYKGMMIPKNKALLYLLVSGNPEVGGRRWFESRIQMYPLELRALCKRFVDNS
ncbi:hypothetical protein [Pseudomonas sp. GV071]|uniref:hypothetical protein n=1 Tax=Pseudomonas sp. GV071 TaxID=2135754 RepID=UPI000D45C988|nr:hypothetical protein [Pseudomonas sp. GV071]PTQ66760.1 hypothetical protein C8K61_11932 [Pseudomonas sp. GV071]